MTYSKPEVVGLASALKAIESGVGNKSQHNVTDTISSPYLSTGAYDADE